MKTDFLRLGFDVREARTEGDYSADALAWPQATKAYNMALSSGFRENSFELLEAVSLNELGRLDEIVRSCAPSAALIELAVFGIVARAQVVGRLAYNPDGFVIEETAVQAEGYDVCDLDGFFSAFEINSSKLQRGLGCPSDKLLDACVIAEAANFLVPAHAPFVTVRVRVLKPAFTKP